MKGELDGIRYVEDEPYYLYTASMDYDSARDDQDSEMTTISTEVKLEFENIITAHNAYNSAVELTAEMAEDLDQLVYMNLLGEVDGDEVGEKQEEYQAQQLDTLGMLSDYNELLLAYDRLTCGGITKLLNGAALDGASGSGGNMLSTSLSNDDPYYYITSRVSDMLVEVGVNIPFDFELEITDFELWYAGTQIGERTSVDEPIVHLSIAAVNDENMLDIRFYNEDEYVQTCIIDAMTQKGALNFVIPEGLDSITEKAVGTFTTSYNETLGTMTISITPTSGLGITGYVLSDSDGNYIYSSEAISIDESLTYLQLLSEDLEALVVDLYGTSDVHLYNGYLDVNTLKVMAYLEGG